MIIGSQKRQWNLHLYNKERSKRKSAKIIASKEINCTLLNKKNYVEDV